MPAKKVNVHCGVVTDEESRTHYEVLERGNESMRNEFIAIVERSDIVHRARCAELPEAFGQGHTKMAALVALKESVRQLLHTRRMAARQSVEHPSMLDTITLE